MAINYALFENHLTSDPNDYSARVQSSGSVDIDAIADRMIDQGSTTTKADILAVLEDTIKACEGYLLDGYRVNFGGLCEFFPRVSGVFDGITDSFDSSRHRVDVGANPGSRIRKTVRDNASVSKQETVLPSPSPVEYADLTSGETNGTITIGSIGTLNGHRLKYDTAHADEGIYIIDADTGTEFKITAVQKNKPSQLVFLVPTLAPLVVNCQIEVRARFGDEDSKLRMGRLDAVLTKA